MFSVSLQIRVYKSCSVVLVTPLIRQELLVRRRSRIGPLLPDQQRSDSYSPAASHCQW